MHRFAPNGPGKTRGFAWKFTKCLESAAFLMNFAGNIFFSQWDS